MSRYLAWLGGAEVVVDASAARARLNSRRCPRAPTSPATARASVAAAGGDDAVTPRGQVVRVEQVRTTPGPSTRPDVVPRRHDVVVGGTEDDGEWSRTPSPQDTATVLARAAQLVPALLGAQVLGAKVGLRPARPDGAPGACRRRRALLRPRLVGGHPELGVCARGRRAACRARPRRVRAVPPAPRDVVPAAIAGTLVLLLVLVGAAAATGTASPAERTRAGSLASADATGAPEADASGAPPAPRRRAPSRSPTWCSSWPTTSTAS